MKKVLIALATVSFILLLSSENYYIVPNEAIRFRIIPNSNNSKDILMKEVLLNNLSEEIDLLGTHDNINESRKDISSSIESINNKIDYVFNDYNYDMNYDVKYGINYFPEKTYKGVKYESGNYESLVIEIGESEGDNFWCVMFPPLCMIEEEQENIEYKSFIKEMFDKILRNK